MVAEIEIFIVERVVEHILSIELFHEKEIPLLKRSIRSPLLHIEDFSGRRIAYARARMDDLLEYFLFSSSLQDHPDCSRASNHSETHRHPFSDSKLIGGTRIGKLGRIHLRVVWKY